ncbi:MAG: MFS transporter, partial [Vicinamibacteria bacterium]
MSGVLNPDGRRLFAARAVRTFAFGWLSVVLALALARLGLSAARIGGIFTATMVEDAVLTIVLSSFAARVGPARLMAWTAPLITLGGVLLAVAEDPRLLIAGAVLGTLSPNGLEAGPFSPMEQAMLPDTVPASARTWAFGWYNVFGFLPAALGSLAAGAWLGTASFLGLGDLTAYRCMLWAYAAAGLVLALIYARLARSRKGGAEEPRVVAAPASPLHRSRRIVLELSALQGLDALAGGFIMQSLLAYWFHVRFGVGVETLGMLFFGTNLLSAVSFLVASRVADRIGLLNTMVFTHLPSNVLLLMVPLMPSFPVAAAVLLARHVLSQMDVPTRQAYTMALVAPEERPAAAGFTTSVRAIAQSCAPALSGLALKTAGSGIPFAIAGGLKIVYDLGLYARFRGVPL